MCCDAVPLMLPYTALQAKIVLDEVLEKLPDVFDVADIRSRVDEFTPYIMVAIQVSHPCGLLLHL